MEVQQAAAPKETDSQAERVLLFFRSSGCAIVGFRAALLVQDGVQIPFQHPFI